MRPTVPDIFDVAEDQAPTSVVPGTHRVPLSPAETYAAKFGGGESGGDGDADLLDSAAMPNCVKFVAPAGSACIFDLATWHTAQPNTSAHERENLILGYHSRRTRSPTGHLIPAETLRRLDDKQLLRPAARGLLGLDDPDWFTGNPFDSIGEVRKGVGRRQADSEAMVEAEIKAAERRNFQAMDRDEMGHDNETVAFRTRQSRYLPPRSPPPIPVKGRE